MSDIKTQEFFVKKPLEEKLGEEQHGRMKVGSQIIQHLSKGIYSTPAMAVKELVSNAFDADATEVKIETKVGSGSIVIHDNGLGMDYLDFDQNFTFISKSEKTDESKKTTKLGRPTIGKLGIGFIAVSALCDTMVVSSAKKGANTKFIAVIDFSKFKDKKYEDVEFSDISEFTLTNYPKDKLDESYTHIELLGISEGFRAKLEGVTAKGKHKQIKKTDFYSVVKEIWNTKIHINIKQKYGPYWEFVMQLASIVPVGYLLDGPIRKIAKTDPSIIKPIKELVSSFNFKVYLDNLELKKPYLFPTKNMIESGDFTVLPFNDTINVADGKTVSYIGYMYNQDGGITVDDWRGLIVRIKNTSIGIIDYAFLGYPYEGDTLYYKWTFGEIYVTEGLEDAMNVDRATFKTADPEYFEFTKSVHRKLREEVFNSVQQRWRQKTKQQREDLEKTKMKWRKSSLKKAFNKDFKVEISRMDFKSKPINLDLKNRILQINEINEILTTFPPKERRFLQDVLIAVAISREKYKNNLKRQDEFLLELLKDLAKKYPKPSLKYDRSTTGKKD